MPWPKTFPAVPPTGFVLAVRAAAGWRALHARVHVALVVVTDVEHVVVPLEHPGETGEADVEGAAVAALGDHALVAALDRERRSDSGRDADAFPNSECSHGSCQDDSG